MDRRQLLVGLGASALTGCATSAPPLAIARPAVATDVDILRRAYTQLHPGLMRYLTPGDLARTFARLERDLAASDGLAGDYLALSRFCGAVRCGHTYANFYNQSDAVAAALFSGRNRLPFHFRWLGARMVVTLNQTDDARLSPGAEILAIDDRPVRDILRALLPLARADGGNDDKRRALLSVTGVDRYEAFDVYFPLVFPPTGDRFVLDVRPAGAVTSQRIDVAPIDLAQRRAAMQTSLLDENAPQWTLAMREGAAILTMPSWALYDSKWDWQAFLSQSFEAIIRDAPRGLIVDLRGNEGGLDCGHAIIARLIDGELPIGQYERKVRFRRTPDDLNPYLDTWDKSFRRLGEDGVDVGGGFFRLPEEDGVSSIQPLAPRYRGKVVVLTDAQNSSATFQFAQLIQANGLGVLCGAPTGGNQRGINGGAFFFLRLPATGIEVDLPLIGRFPKTPQPDAGLTPDIRVEETLADIASGADPVLSAALSVIARG